MNRMQEKFDRSQFHELVWSKQISDIAKEYELSESKLKDIAREYDIPMPDRNYWLAKSRGETPQSKPLPRRRFAGGQYIYLKGSPRHYYYWGSVTKEELYAPLLESKPENTEQFNLDKWSNWALKTADLIDPIISESFKEIILEKE